VSCRRSRRPYRGRLADLNHRPCRRGTRSNPMCAVSSKRCQDRSTAGRLNDPSAGPARSPRRMWLRPWVASSASCGQQLTLSWSRFPTRPAFGFCTDFSRAPRLSAQGSNNPGTRPRRPVFLPGHRRCRRAAERPNTLQYTVTFPKVDAAGPSASWSLTSPTSPPFLRRRYRPYSIGSKNKDTEYGAERPPHSSWCSRSAAR